MTTGTTDNQLLFEPFRKIARLSRECVITEKIDGTNAQVHVLDDGTVLAASRTRYITPENDNYGFAAWVRDHTDELRELGPGRHYGEWWGQGIQRGYGLSEKRFSLFNTGRWSVSNAPTCCHVVPVLYTGIFITQAVDYALLALVQEGSAAAYGFMDPEGVVVYHVASRTYFKKTIFGDAAPKNVLVASQPHGLFVEEAA